jgi:hypothetical protein
MQPLTCAKCGSPLERAPGPGRPPSFCGAACKRLVEYEVRRLDRRIADYELEQRGLKFDGPDHDDRDRQRRMRALRRWIRADRERLRALLGRSDAPDVQINQEGAAN